MAVYVPSHSSELHNLEGGHLTSEGRIVSRMGDGSRVEMTRSEIRADLEAGTRHAAERAKVSPLTPTELEHLFDVRVVGALRCGRPRRRGRDQQRWYRDRAHRQQSAGPADL